MSSLASTASQPAPNRRPGHVRKLASALSSVVLLVAGLVVATTVAVTTAPIAAAATTPVSPGVSPIAQRTSGQVTADALPTVQIDGIVWSQAVVGAGANGTVYAGGSFANARPAGSAAGSNLTARGNLLAYNIGTGNLVTSFAPNLNQQVLAVAASPDGSRIYIGGDFTSADGVTHNRLAAYSTSTGQLISSFTPNLNGRVRAIYATNSTVYVGGGFTTANGNARVRLAAFNTSGGLLNWAPTADDTVNALVLTPDGTKLIVGGYFQNVNGAPAYGLAALDANTGGMVPWAANQTVRDAGANSAIESLSTDGTSIFGTGYVFGAGGNLEGAFSADPTSGAINWIEDCHGDTYSNYAMNGALYTVSHSHYCGNIGSYFQSNPLTTNQRRAQAFTIGATGTITKDYLGYYNWAGYSSPSMINWFPDLNPGSFSGQGQAAWSVTGNGTYVVLGGEFPSVNGGAQQGLVRFAVSGVAPSKLGVRVTGAASAPSLVSTTPGTVRVAFQANWDRDDKTLVYKVYRDSSTTTPIYTVTADSEFWNRPALGFTDTGLAPGSSHSYRIVETDSDGNSFTSNSASITVASTSPFSAYANDVLAAGATKYWRLGEASGTRVYDYAGNDDATVVTAITRGATGPISGDSSTASTFDGSASLVVNQAPAPAPTTFSVGAWFSTTSTSGGKIVGYGNENAGNSVQYDRNIYLDAAGLLHFGVSLNGTKYTVDSTVKYNDGNWHQVVGTFGANGLSLYVDGQLIGVNQSSIVAQSYNGFWRIGGDTSWSGSPYFNGSIAEVAIYPTAISGAAVRKQYVDSGRTFTGVSGPTDAFGQAIYQDNPALYYRMDDTSGTIATDSSGNNAVGTYRGGITLGATSNIAGTYGSAATLNGASGTTISSPTAIAAPKFYSEELWFKTTSTTGGELMSFGSAASGNSATYDRVVYLANNGQVSYRVRPTSSTTATITTTGSYNDGSWHHLVATMGPDGMKLYLDGALKGTNANTNLLAFNGFWRIGGDAGYGGTSTYLAGSVDEAAVYNYPLTATQVTAHRNASPSYNKIPTASFTSTANKLAASFDGSASADPDGSIASYSWNYGDGTAVSTATTATTAHTYTAAGTYNVTLTVTDNSGGVNVITNPVTVVANVPPTAAFGITTTGLALAVDATKSADTDGSIASYTWNYGDNSPVVTGSSPTANYTYAASGTYTVTLTVTDNNGAATSLAKSVTVSSTGNVPPKAAFTATAAKLVGSFDASASTDYDGSISSYAWNYGDNTPVVTTTVPTSSHTYTAAGTFTVTLTLTDNSGATTAATQTLKTVANVAPTAGFTATANKLNIAFDGTASADSDGTIASYAWNFGDGSAGVTISTGKTTYTYANAGTYSVTLTVTDNNGATTSVSKSVTAIANVLPAVSFTAKPTKLVLALDASASTDSDGTIKNYTWDYGDGTTPAILTTPTTSHTYTAAGTYTVSLTVTDNNGGQTISSQSVTVVVNAPPTASFTATTTKLAVAFNASASADSDGSITSYAWNYGDNSATVTSTSPTVNYTYAASGTYTVSLTTTDNNGATTTSTQSLKVSTNANVAPTASFTAKANKLSVAFNGSASADSDGSIASYTWNYGDNSAAVTTTTPTNTYVYAAAGTYTVTLTVTDNSNATTSVSKSVTVVANVLPTASFTATVTKLVVAVNGSASTDSDGTIASYSYNYGDGTVAVTSSSATGSHTYNSAGTFTVTLTVTDNNGGTASTTRSVTTVNNVPPTSSFTATPTKLSVAFDGSASADSDGTIASYAWNYGDNSAVVTNTTPTSTYTYSAAGTYSVTLTVTDNNGATTSSTKSVTVVANVPPTASFTATANNLAVSFDGSASADSDGTISSYAWNYGDNSAVVTKTTPTTSYTYAAAGTYTVTLTVTDNNGATTTSSQSFTFHGATNIPPTASFTATATKLSVAFDGSASKDSDGTIASYAWNYGDNSAVVTGTSPTSTYVYAAGGTYTVTLTVTDNSGASTVATKSITVVANVPPTASFTAAITKLAVAFDGSASADSDGTIASYAWNYGDNSAVVTGTSPTSNYTYAANGTYTVTLTVTDNNGGPATVATKSNHGGGQCRSDGRLRLHRFGAGRLVRRVDVERPRTARFLPTPWDYGDGSAVATSSSPTSSHTYASAATYIVKLTVTDNSGATGTVSQSIAITTVATDAFGRTLSGSWGSADTGGPWTLSGTASAFNVANGAGTMQITAAGSGPSAYLKSATATNINGTVDIALSAVPTTGDVRLPGRPGERDHLLPNSADLHLQGHHHLGQQGGERYGDGDQPGQRPRPRLQRRRRRQAPAADHRFRRHVHHSGPGVEDQHNRADGLAGDRHRYHRCPADRRRGRTPDPTSPAAPPRP